MGLYSRYVLPRLIDAACRSDRASAQRELVVPRARGTVLEVGIGSGLNLPFYDASKVGLVIGIDPSGPLRRRAAPAAAQAPFDVELHGASAEEIHLDDESVDTVVITYTLCSIPDAERAAREMARVLKRGGELLFCEHGQSPEPSVRQWQRWANPAWKRVSGGCHLGRDIPGLLASGGFALTDVGEGYIPGWKPACYNWWGVARLADNP